MDPLYTSLLSLGESLAELTIKSTVTKVASKIKSLKNEKDLEKVRNVYDEIVNQLLQEREEAIRVAQGYKSEVDRIVISDDDIKHLHNTVSRIIEIVVGLQLSGIDASQSGAQEMIKTQIESYNKFKELISVDTLKTMQLLGFNYKAAIGEPLTHLCAEAIENIGKKNHSSNNSKNSNRKR